MSTVAAPSIRSAVCTLGPGPPQPLPPQSVEGAANGPSMTVPFQCSHNDNQALVLAREPFWLLKGSWLSALMGHYLWILNLSSQTTVFPFFPHHWQKPSFCALSTLPNLFVLETKKKKKSSETGVKVNSLGTHTALGAPEATSVPVPAGCECQPHLCSVEAPQCGPPSTSHPSCSCFVSLEASLA